MTRDQLISVTDTRLPDRWLNDRRIQRSPAHFQSYVNSLMWSVANRTDGQIEQSDLGLIPNFDPGVVPDFTKTELWSVTTSGWLINDYRETQTTRAEHEALAQARAANRERQARFRAAKAEQERAEATEQGNQISNVTCHVTETVTETVTPAVTTQGRGGKAKALPPEVRELDLDVPSLSSQDQLLPNRGTSPAKRAPSKRGTRLPDGWQPPDDVIRAMHAELPMLDLKAQHRKFTDHFKAAPGQKGVKVDWPATWRNWMRNAAERGETPAHNGHPVGRATQKAMGWESLKDTSERKELNG